MGLISRVARVGIVLSIVLAAPSLAAAQFTLSGRLIDQIPGGGAIVNPRVLLYQVATDGQTTWVKTLFGCPGGGSNCIDDTGGFEATSLVSGLYLLYVFGDHTLPKAVNATVNGDTDMGDVGVIRGPFDVEVKVGDIPATGGLVPVSVRVKAMWAVPTLPIAVTLTPFHDAAFVPSDLAPQILNVMWPAGLTDTGFVPITPLNVSPSDPAGGEHCVGVNIRLRTDPPLQLRSEGGCAQKRP